MIDLLLIGIIVVLIAERTLSNYLDRRERKSILNYKISKDAAELRDLEASDRTNPKPQLTSEPDFIHESQAPEALWDKAVQRELDVEAEDNG